ncbi:MAG TPA: hypothetical protein EYN67_01695 [Flavobacteriales bacterium]|nr:hypothetical protein [Flavobacteriales bacterium]
MAITENLRDDSTGLVHAFVYTYGVGAGFGDKYIEYVPSAQITSFGVAKILRVDYTVNISGGHASLHTPVMDKDLDTWSFNSLGDFDKYDAFIALHPDYIQSQNNETSTWRRTWKPKKFAMNYDQKLGLVINAHGLFSGTWDYSMSMYVRMKML